MGFRSGSGVRRDVMGTGIKAKEKLAYRVAQRIADDILGKGWIVGDKLGIETDLLRRYSVSREPFREAIQILERQGIVTTGRGPHGGLIIQAPAIEAVSNVIRTYFEFSNVSFAEVMEAQELLQIYAVELAAERITPAHANDIRRVLDRPRPTFRSRDQEGRGVMEIYDAVTRVAGNPSLSMLIFTLSRTVADFGHQEKYPKQLWKSMIDQTWATVERIARCTMRGDSAGALRAVRAENALVERTVRGLSRYNERIWNTRSYVSGSLESATLAHPGRDKAATILAYRIAAHIRRNQLEPGTTLGTEPQLMKLFGVSRAMFRSALRMLEFFGVVTVKRGIEGGLTVSEPNPEPTVQTAVLYLRYFRPPADDLVELHERMQRDIARAASTRISHLDIIGLLNQLKLLTETTAEQFREASIHVHRNLVASMQNAATSLIMDIVLNTRISLLSAAISAAKIKRARLELSAASRHLTLALESKDSASLVPAIHSVFEALNLAYED